MLAKTDLDLVTDAELEWMLGVVQSVDSPMRQTKLRSPRERTACGPKPRCDQLHARLVSMNVRYQTLDGEGFELSNDDVTVSALGP